MVKGLEKFRSYFRNYHGSYVIIGGSACDITISEAGLNPRTTKDIDLILIVEAISLAFVLKFWEFIKEGGYEIREKGEKDRQYYRFRRPEDSEFPDQIEIFARNPDLLDLKEGSHLGPLPVPEDITSLSAILLDDDYYRYTIDHSRFTDALKIANIESLICLKARAFLDLTKRKETGETIPERKIRKHKLDIFRLATMLTADDNFILPANIKADMQSFIESIKDEMPGNEIFKEMGLGKVNVEELFDLIIKNYNLRK